MKPIGLIPKKMKPNKVFLLQEMQLIPRFPNPAFVNTVFHGELRKYAKGSVKYGTNLDERMMAALFMKGSFTLIVH